MNDYKPSLPESGGAVVVRPLTGMPAAEFEIDRLQKASATANAYIITLKAALAAEQARNREMAATVERLEAEYIRNRDAIGELLAKVQSRNGDFDAAVDEQISLKAQRDKLLAQNAGLREALTRASVWVSPINQLSRDIAAILASQPEEKVK